MEKENIMPRNDREKVFSNINKNVLDGIVEFEKFLGGLDYIRVEYPANNTGYSTENLCSKLSICADAKESFIRFDEYCSGDYNKCPYRVLN